MKAARGSRRQSQERVLPINRDIYVCYSQLPMSMNMLQTGSCEESPWGETPAGLSLKFCRNVNNS